MLINDPPTGSPIPSVENPLPSIRNNILVGNDKAGINAGTLASGGATCSDWVDKRDYNLFSANASAADSCADFAPWCKRPQLAKCNENSGEIFADPLFIDAANDNYHLQGSSPALDSGDSGVEMGAYGGSNSMTDGPYGVPDSQ